MFKNWITVLIRGTGLEEIIRLRSTILDHFKNVPLGLGMLRRGLVPIMLRKLVIENQAMGSGGRVFWWMKSIFRWRRTFRKYVASVRAGVGELGTGASDCE